MSSHPLPYPSPKDYFRATGGSKGGSPLFKIYLMSCSLLENLAKLYVGPPPWRVGAPLTGNPGSVPESHGECYTIADSFKCPTLINSVCVSIIVNVHDWHACIFTTNVVIKSKYKRSNFYCHAATHFGL